MFFSFFFLGGLVGLLVVVVVVAVVMVLQKGACHTSLSSMQKAGVSFPFARGMSTAA